MPESILIYNHTPLLEGRASVRRRYAPDALYTHAVISLSTQPTRAAVRRAAAQRTAGETRGGERDGSAACRTCRRI